MKLNPVVGIGLLLLKLCNFAVILFKNHLIGIYVLSELYSWIIRCYIIDEMLLRKLMQNLRALKRRMTYF